MPIYQIRFLRSDDTCARVETRDDFASDTEISEYVRTSYGQKPLEIWHADRLVVRRVSSRHDARLKGWYPRSCRYAALSSYSLRNLEKGGEIPYSQFEQLGLASQAVFLAIKSSMASYRVWIRAEAHPAAPKTIQNIRVSFHPSWKDRDRCLGSTNVSVFSPARDGDAIPEDLCDAIESMIIPIHQRTGMFEEVEVKLQRSPLTTYGGEMHLNMCTHWAIALQGP